MARRKRIDPADVVWHAPETLHSTLPDVAERFNERLKDATPEDIIRAAQEQVGEYRQLQGTRLSEEGLEEPVYGADRLQWVSDAPDDVEDGSGHYEIYDGPDDEYQPVVQRPQED